MAQSDFEYLVWFRKYDCLKFRFELKQNTWVLVEFRLETDIAETLPRGTVDRAEHHGAIGF